MLPIDNIIQWSNTYLEDLGGENFEVKSLQGSFKGWKGAFILIAAYNYAKPGQNVIDVEATRAQRDAGKSPSETIDTVIKLLADEFSVPEYVDSSQMMNPDKKCIRMYMSEVVAKCKKSTSPKQEEANPNPGTAPTAPAATKAAPAATKTAPAATTTEPAATTTTAPAATATIAPAASTTASKATTLIDGEVEKELSAIENENEKEMAKAKRKFERMQKKLNKHPHAAAKAQRAIASTALKKIKLQQARKSEMQLARSEVEGTVATAGDTVGPMGGLHRTKSTLGDYGAKPTALTRGKSFINRFNPGESSDNYRKKHEGELMETLLWLKLKLLVNQIQKEKEEEIEVAWQAWLLEHPETMEPDWNVAAEAQWSIMRGNLVTVAMITSVAKGLGEKQAHRDHVLAVVNEQWRQSKAKIILGVKLAHEAAVATSQVEARAKQSLVKQAHQEAAKTWQKLGHNVVGATVWLEVQSNSNPHHNWQHIRQNVSVAAKERAVEKLMEQAQAQVLRSAEMQRLWRDARKGILAAALKPEPGLAAALLEERDGKVTSAVDEQWALTRGRIILGASIHGVVHELDLEKRAMRLPEEAAKLTEQNATITSALAASPDAAAAYQAFTQDGGWVSFKKNVVSAARIASMVSTSGKGARAVATIQPEEEEEMEEAIDLVYYYHIWTYNPRFYSLYRRLIWRLRPWRPSKPNAPHPRLRRPSGSAPVGTRTRSTSRIVASAGRPRAIILPICRALRSFLTWAKPPPPWNNLPLSPPR